MKRTNIPGENAVGEEFQAVWDEFKRIRMGLQGIIETDPVAGEGTVGPAGPAGANGATGPAGPAGPAGADAPNYIHEQAVPAAVWTINHNLSRYPQVTVVDSAGTQVEGGVEYNSTDTITITFSVPFGGRAFIGG